MCKCVYMCILWSAYHEIIYRLCIKIETQQVYFQCDYLVRVVKLIE